MVTAYDCNPVNTISVTNNLDIWIGLELDREINSKLNNTKINLYAMKLHNILESKDFRDGEYSYVCDETKRLRAEWYDK